MAAGDAGVLNIDYSQAGSVITDQGVPGLDTTVYDTNSVVPTPTDMAPAMAAAAGVPFVPAPTGMTVDGASSTAAATNPNNTGGWENTAMNIINAAAKGFSTYVSGSPSAGIPRTKSPTGKNVSGILTTASGQTNWAMIALIAVAAGLGVWALIRYA